MPHKVKRGLGLLVIAIPLWLIALGVSQWAPTSTAGDVAHLLLLVVAGLGWVAAALAGFVLIAWGLLRD